MHPTGDPEPTGYTTPHSLTCWPAATVRCGTSADGLPICVQIAGRPWEETVVLAAAQRLEDALGGFSPPRTLYGARA
jgi:amidase